MTTPHLLALPSALGDRAAAWSYIRGFAAYWGTPLGEDDGAPEAALSAAEERLGLHLPAAVREAYTLFGHRPDLHSNLHELLAPDDLRVEHDALVFRDENQGAASWGILLVDLDDPDPAVRIRPDLADKSAERWEPWLDRFSVTALEIVLSESTQGPEDLCDFRDLDEGEDLPDGFTRLDFPMKDQTFYAGPGVLLCDAGGWLSVRARDPETLDSFRDAHPGDWLNA